MNYTSNGSDKSRVQREGQILRKNFTLAVVVQVRGRVHQVHIPPDRKDAIIALLTWDDGHLKLSPVELDTIAIVPEDWNNE